MSIRVLIGYARARLEQEKYDLRFRYYVTDVLFLLGETMAEAFGGRFLEKRFCDVLFPMAEQTRKGDEVLHDVLSEIGFNGGDGGEFEGAC